MPPISAFLSISLVFLSDLETSRCSADQKEPLFLSYSKLAAQEEKCLHPADGPPSHFNNQNPVVVKCPHDNVEVVVRSHLSEPRYLFLGHRTMKPSRNGKVIIRAPLADCWSTLTVGEPLHGYSKSACFLQPPSGVTLTVRLVCSSPLLLWCITTCCCCLRLQHLLQTWCKQWELLYCCSVDTGGAFIHKMSSWVLQ